MNRSDIRIKMTLTILFLMLCSIVDAGYISWPAKVEIATPTPVIRVAEPLVIKLIYRFDKPQVSTQTGTVFTKMPHEASIKIKYGSDETLIPPHTVLAGTISLQGTEELEYAGNFLLFFDHSRKKPIFDKPGTYTVTVLRTKDHVSNPLSITVEPASELDKLGISFFSDPNTFAFLEYGDEGYLKTKPDIASRLREVVNSCGDSIWAKWSAGRLGLEYYRDFLMKYPMFNQLSSEQRSVAIKDELFTQTTTLLDKATVLPDEFPIREEVLYRLSSAEFMKGNYKKTFSLLDELDAKYPYGEYGKKASRGKAELQELIKNTESEKPSRPRIVMPGIVLPVISVLAAGIVLTGLVLLLRKKARSRGK